MKRFILAGFLILDFLSVTSQDFDAELVFQETDITVEKNRLLKTLSYEIRINNRTGEKYAAVDIPFSKLRKVSNIEAFIKDKYGKIIKKLKKSDITEKSLISNSSFYEDNYIKEFTLRHSSYPYSIFYTYEEQQNEIFFIDYWLPVIDIKVPTREAVLKLAVPKDYAISFSNHFTDSCTIDSLDFQIRYRWTASYKNILKSEIFSPPVKSYLPHVIIVPDNFKYYFNGSFISWIAFGDWLYSVNQNLSDLPVSEKNTINSLINGIIDKKEQIKRLYHYLQDQTRYINVSIETGGLIPYPASYVAENKYGDCKALTNYFKSVLEFIGIESYYTLVNAGEPTVEIDKDFPSQQFNHVILCIPDQIDTIWLDCTSDGAFNYLGTFTQNREALVIDKNKSTFRRTPSLSADEVVETRSVKLSLNEKKEGIADFNNSYMGDKFELLLSLSNSLSESKKSQIIRNYLIEKGFQLINFKLFDVNRDSSIIHLCYSANNNQIYNIYTDEVIINLIPFTIPEFEEPAKRNLPVQIDYPLHKCDTIEYYIPKGYKLTNELNDQSLLTEFGRYKINFEKVSGNKIRVVKEVLINRGYYHQNKYKEFYNFIHAIGAIEHNVRFITSKL